MSIWQFSFLNCLGQGCYEILLLLESSLISLETGKWIIIFFFQLVVGVPLPLKMVPLIHIKIQLRELRYSSDATQGLSQLGG